MYTSELLLRVCVRVRDIIMCACDRVEKPVLSIIIDNGQPSENSGAFEEQRTATRDRFVVGWLGGRHRGKWHSAAREAVDIRQQIPVTACL